MKGSCRNICEAVHIAQLCSVDHDAGFRDRHNGAGYSSTYVFFRLMMRPKALQLGSRETGSKLLYIILCVGCQGTVIRKQKVTDKGIQYFGFSLQTSEVKETSVCPGAYYNASAGL